MKSYQAVRAKIAELEKQAEALRVNELKGVIAQVKAMIDEYGLTASDLGLAGRRGAAPKGRGRVAGAASPRRVRASAGVAKYRNPETDETWTGHGRPPGWILAAADRSVYLISGATAAGKRSVAAKTRNGKVAKPAKAAKTVARKRGKAAVEENAAEA